MSNHFSVEVCQTPCEFPFTYKGTQHDGCITHDNDGTPWCDIGNGQKGNCTSACPGNLVLTVQYFHNEDQPFFQLKFVRPLVSSPLPTKVNSMISASKMTMMTHHGVILVMVKRVTVRLLVQVTIATPQLKAG